MKDEKSERSKSDATYSRLCSWIHRALQSCADVMMLNEENLENFHSKIYTVESGFAAEVRWIASNFLFLFKNVMWCSTRKNGSGAAEKISTVQFSSSFLQRIKELSETNSDMVLVVPKFGDHPIRLCKSHSVSWLEADLMEPLWGEEKGPFCLEKFGVCTKFVASLQVSFLFQIPNKMSEVTLSHHPFWLKCCQAI